MGYPTESDYLSIIYPFESLPERGDSEILRSPLGPGPGEVCKADGVRAEAREEGHVDEP